MQAATLAQALARVPKLGYSIEEASVICGLSRATLYRALDAGRITSIRDGRRRVIPRSELESLMQHLQGRGTSG